MLAALELSLNALWLCRLQLDDLTGQHETYARQLRDRLLREQDLAVERERAAAQDRLREAAERYPPLPCIQKRYLSASRKDTKQVLKEHKYGLPVGVSVTCAFQQCGSLAGNAKAGLAAMLLLHCTLCWILVCICAAHGAAVATVLNGSYKSGQLLLFALQVRRLEQ